jgi:hypothetical protein
MVRSLSLEPDSRSAIQDIPYFYGSLMSIAVFTRFCIWNLIRVDWTKFIYLPHIVRLVLIINYHFLDVMYLMCATYTDFLRSFI